MTTVYFSPLRRAAAAMLCGLAVLLLAGCAQVSGVLGLPPVGAGAAAHPPTATKPDADDEAVAAALERAGLYPTWVAPHVLRLDMPSNAAFAPGAADVPAAMRSTLHTVALQMKSPLLQQWQLLVVGHADDRGSDADNLVMSRARAAAVQHAIEGQGIAATRLASDGRGEREPLATNAQRYGRELNRRVELFLSLGALPPGATAPQ